MEPGLSQPVHGLIVRGGVPGGQRPWREGGRGEDPGAPPSHPYCACARPLGCPLCPGTWGRGDVGAALSGSQRRAIPEALEPHHQWEPLYLWGSGRAERLGPPVSASLIARPEGHWMALGGRRGCFGILRTSVSSGAPESLFPPIHFLFFLSPSRPLSLPFFSFLPDPLYACLFLLSIFWEAWVSFQCLVIQLCPTLCNPMDCSPPGFSARGILQAGILECIAMPSSGGSSPPRERTSISCVSCTGRRVLYLRSRPLFNPSVKSYLLSAPQGDFQDLDPTDWSPVLNPTPPENFKKDYICHLTSKSSENGGENSSSCP